MKCIVCHSYWKEELSLFNYFTREQLLCPSCDKQLIFSEVLRCKHCRKVLGAEEQHCFDCEFIKRYFEPVDAIHCLYDYNDFMKQLISQYKFRKDVQLSELFGAWLYKERINGIVIPVPTSREKLKQRGFDHMRLIVEQYGRPFNDALRMHSRKKQADLSKLERLQEDNPFFIEGRVPAAVTLIDDIYTTGLTVHRAADVLRQNGCRSIKVLTFARA